METLENGQEKLQKICDVLKKETLEPALKEASDLIETAKWEACQILEQAQKEADAIVEKARFLIEQERSIFQSSLLQGARQALESLRQDIESKFFNKELQALIDSQASNPHLIADLINVIVSAIKKEGTEADLLAFIPKHVLPEEVNVHLAEKVLERIQGKSVKVGTFTGGAIVYIKDKHMAIDISDAALKELLATYVRKDFRQLIFSL